MKKLVRKLVMVALAVVLCSGFLFADNPVFFGLGTSTAQAVEVTPCAPALEWYYKVINGKLHKRLFNHSTGQWVGDWIPV